MDADLNKDFLCNLVEETGEDSLADLARNMNVSPSTAKRWLKGRIVTKYIIALCLRYNICIGRFFLINSSEIDDNGPVKYKYIRLLTRKMVEDAMKMLNIDKENDFRQKLQFGYKVFCSIKDEDNKALEIMPQVYCYICNMANLNIFDYIECEIEDDTREARPYTKGEVEAETIKDGKEFLDKYSGHIDKNCQKDFVNDVVKEIKKQNNMTENIVG